MSKKPIVIAVAVIVVALGAVAIKWGLADNVASGDYYTQIDNDKVHELHSDGGVIDLTGGMSWEYTLDASNDAGDMREISFGTERKLREGAYLKLTVVLFRGVVEWSEVQFEEMPSKAQAALR